MNIHKLITNVNKQINSNTDRIKYIVVHYVGATGGAEANCRYYASKYIGASAHYFVGHKGEVWQSVDDKDIAWHCGAKSYKHTHCRNANSIGVEMCCRNNGSWYFEQATVDSTIALVKDLMRKYNVPASNVIRHYDVTGKTCPEPYVRDNAAWQAFKAALVDTAPAQDKVNELPQVPFSVQVIIDDLNFRAQPSMQGAVKGQTGKGLFTIVEVKDGWGKLKSGAGWIWLENPSYCSVKGAAAATVNKPSIDEVARDIIKGKYGNGHAARKTKVEALGLDYEQVRKRVNELLK